MRTQATYGMCREASIPADGIAYAFKPDINELGKPIAWERGIIAIELAVVVPYEEVAGIQFAVQLSHDDETWLDVSIYDLRETAGGDITLPSLPSGGELGDIPTQLEAIAAQREIQAAAVQIDEAISAAIIGIDTSAPYMRVLVSNNGENAASLSMWFYATR